MSAPTKRAFIAGVAATATAPLLARAESGVIHDVLIESFMFAPEVVEAKVGDRIRWTNLDLAPHTATADDHDWDTGSLAANQAGEIEVREGMTEAYFCAFHPHMKGAVKIIG